MIRRVVEGTFSYPGWKSGVKRPRIKTSSRDLFYKTGKLSNLFSVGGLTKAEDYMKISIDESLLSECVEKEINASKEFLKHLDDFDSYYQIQDEIRNRRTSSLQEPAEIFGDFEYFSQTRVHRDSSYHVLLRKCMLPAKNQSNALSNPTEVVFDPLADKIVPVKYLGTHSIFTNSLSHDQQKCFVVVDIKTDERPTGFIKDIKQQKVLPERIPSVAEGQFNTSGSVLLYIKRDESLRNSKLKIFCSMRKQMNQFG
jgi:protease II